LIISRQGARQCLLDLLSARIGAQTTPGGVVVVANSSAIGFSSALPDADWITARIHRDLRDAA